MEDDHQKRKSIGDVTRSWSKKYVLSRAFHNLDIIYVADDIPWPWNVIDICVVQQRTIVSGSTGLQNPGTPAQADLKVQGTFTIATLRMAALPPLRVDYIIYVCCRAVITVCLVNALILL